MRVSVKQGHKYLQVAEGLEKMIREEILKVGDKLPSVRMLSDEYGISQGTAFQAYYHLEGKGLIEARPKSGYYVRYNFKRMPGIMRCSRPEPVVKEVSTQQMIAAVFRDMTATDITNLSVGSPNSRLLPAAKLNKSIIHALRNSPTSCLHYDHIQGNEELRKQVARLCFNWGGRVSADDIVITAGCMEALVMSLRAVTRPGDTVAVESPTYFGLYQVIQILGLKIVEMPTDPVTGVDLDYFEKAITRFGLRAAVFVPNFNNPLGSCMPDSHKKRLVEIITRHRIPLIEDDIYGELYFSAHRPKTCKSYDTEGWVIQCGSLSKSLAPGYRIGWCVAGRYAEQITQIKMMHTISGTTLTQQAMAHFLSIGRYDYHLKQLRKVLHTQCLRYTQAISEYFPEDVKVSRPQGGFVLWLELNQKVDSYKLYQEAMRHQISVTPGHLFSSQGQYNHFIRIGYGNPFDDSIDHGLQVLGGLVKRMQR